MAESQNFSELDYYKYLGSPNEDERINGSFGIASAVKKCGMDCFPYVLRRLVQGLGGPNLRKGCYATLFTIVQNLPKGTLDFTLLDKIVQNVLKPCKNSTKKEVGNALMGELLVLSIIIRTNLIYEEKENVREIIASRIFLLGLKKSYLHNISFTLLGEMISNLQKEYIPEGMLEHLGDLNTHTLDKLYYLFCLNSVNKESQLVAHVLKSEHTPLIHKANSKFIAELLAKNTTSELMDHPFYKVFYTLLSKKKVFLKHFWNEFYIAIEHKKKTYVYLSVLNGILPELRCDKNTFVKIILNSTLLEVLLKWRDDTKLVTSILEKFIDVLKEAESSEVFEVVKILIMDEGRFLFDKTFFYFVKFLLNNLNAEHVKSLSKFYKGVITGELMVGNSKIWTNKDKVLASRELARLINHSACVQDAQWRLDQFIFLGSCGLFRNDTPILNVELASIIRKMFFNTIGQKKLIKLSSYHDILHAILKFVLKEVKKGKDLYVKLDKATTAKWVVWANWANKEMQCHDTSFSEEKPSSFIHLLALYIAIQALNSPKISIENLGDVKKIFNYANGLETLTKDQPQWIEVLVDLLLNMLSRPSAGHKQFIFMIFKYLVNYMNDEAFFLILDVLDPGKSNEKYADVSDKENIPDQESYDDDDDLSEEEDDVKINIPTSTSPGDDDVDSVDLDMMDENDRTKLNKILGGLVKAKSDKRKVKRESDLSHFKMKVLNLLEMCAVHEGGVPARFWLAAVPVISELHKHTISVKNEQTLSKKLALSCKKLGQVKHFKNVDGIEPKNLIKLIGNIFEDAIQPALKFSSEPFLNMIKLLIKVADTISQSNMLLNNRESILFSVINVLSCSFKDKHHIPSNLYATLLNLNWSGCYNYLIVVIKTATNIKSGVNERLRCMQILRYFFQKNLYPTEAPFDDPIFKSALNKIKKYLKNIDNDELLKSNKQLCHEFFNLVNVLSQCKFSNEFDWQSIANGFKSVVSINNCPNKMNKSLREILGFNMFGVIKKNKKKVPKQEMKVDHMEGTKKRKHDSRMLKKKSKKLRLEGFSIDYKDGFTSLPIEQ